MFQVRRAIARALTAAPARIAPEQLVKCSFQRSTLLQSQPCRRFSRIQPRFAEVKPSPPQDKQSTLAEERTEIREEAEVQPEVASEAQEAATEQEYAAVSESTDQIPAGADSSTSTSANAASDQEHAAVSETTDQIPTNHQSSAPAASRFAAPSNGKPASSLADRQLFVSNLYWGVTDADLQSLFQPFGDVRGARVIYGADGRSRGFGFVEMKTVQEVRAAIDGLHETLLEGRAISVKVTQRAHLGVTAQGNRPSRRFTPPSKTLFIGGLSEQMSDADLNNLFRDIKNVLDVRVAIDRRTGGPRGFAHADFISIEAAQTALQALNNRLVHGRYLKVDFAEQANSQSHPARNNNMSSESSF